MTSNGLLPPAPQAPGGKVLLARLDSLGDVLLTGGAVRAVAARAESVTMLVGAGRAAGARLLPGVDEVVEFAAGWVDFNPPPISPPAVEALVARLRREAYESALIFTSYHQSPLPLALLLRLAGVGWVGAISEDYPGSLLDLRHRVPDDLHEAERNLSLAIAAGFPADPDGARLAVREPLPDVTALVGPGPYVVVHPGAAVAARRPSPATAHRLVAALAAAGRRVVVTGALDEAALAASAVGAGTTAAETRAERSSAGASGAATTGPGAATAGPRALNLAGRLDLTQLAAVLAGADAVVAPNTGPAHLAAAVGTPVVSLFAPVVQARNWAPYGVPTVVLGDQSAPCRGSRARVCPVPGHPCLDAIPDAAVVAAVDAVARSPLLLGGRT